MSTLVKILFGDTKKTDFVLFLILCIEQSKNYLNIWSNLFLSTEFEFFMMYQRKKSAGTGREQGDIN
jgi:hypothetical protein